MAEDLIGAVSGKELERGPVTACPCVPALRNIRVESNAVVGRRVNVQVRVWRQTQQARIYIKTAICQAQR